MNPRSNEDTPRDAWLSEALRHAPDAALGPPAEVSGEILRRARAATAPAHRDRPGGVLRGIAAWWAWLARPPVAAGFASLMLATLVGMLWWGRPLDEALPRGPGFATPAPAAAPEARAPIEVPAAPTAAPKSLDAATPQGAQRQGAPKPKLAAAQRESESKMAAHKAAPRADLKSDATVAAGAVASAAEAATSLAAEKSAAAPAPTSPMPLADASDTAPQSPRARAEVAAGVAAPAAAPHSGKSASNEAALRSARAPLEVRAQPVALDALRAALASDPQRWTWQRETGGKGPMNIALQRWLAGLDQTTAQRWRAAPTSLPPGEMREIQLLRDGKLHSTLRIVATTVRIDSADAPTASQEVELPPAAAAALRLDLDAATP